MTSNTIEAAFISAFDQYADALYRHALYRVSDPSRATDITQDAFIKAWDYLSAGGVVSNWRAFLYRILNNLVVDEYRRHKNVSLDALLDDTKRQSAQNALLSAGSRDEKEEQLDEQLLMQKIRKGMARLPEIHRVVLTLRYLDNLGIHEIAEVLEISENSVSVRIHRAVRELRKYCLP